MTDQRAAASGHELDDEATESGESGKKASALKKPWVKRALLIGGLIVIALLAIWIVRYETHGKYVESTDDAYVQADGVTIAPKVSGYVDQVFVADNQHVKAGQPLVKVDPRDYSAQAAQAGAQIDLAQANAENARAMIRQQEAAIAQAQAQLASAQADARFAASEVKRYTPLAASGAETHEKLQTLRNQSAQADAQVAAARAALESARRRIGALQAQVDQAAAQGEAAKAQLASAKVNLGATLIRSSIDGRVGDKTVRVGQFVQAGTRLMTIVPIAQIYVTANFKETQIGLMRVGQPATVEVDALPGVELHGHVESLAPGTGAQFSLLPPQNATGNFTKIVQRVPVRIAIDPGDEARRVLLPGLSVTVKVDTISAKGADDRIEQQQKALERARR